MASTNREYDELLTEHFRYTPLSLIDDIINAVNTIIYRAIEAVETGLLNLPPQQLGFPKSTNLTKAQVAQNQSLQQDEIENGCHQLETLLVDSADKTFDKFEIYTLRNILTVEEGLAPWMRLSHYEGLHLPLPSTAATPESILALRRKVQETRKLNHALKTQHHRNALLINHLQTILSPPPPSTNAPQPSLSFLTTHPSTAPLSLTFTPKAGAEGPLHQKATFTTSQLPALRALLQDLRPKLQTLPDAIGNVDWEGKREERRAYIEGRVRRAVGKGSGDGERRGERIGVDDVEGIEGVARGVGVEL